MSNSNIYGGGTAELFTGFDNNATCYSNTPGVELET